MNVRLRLVCIVLLLALPSQAQEAKKGLVAEGGTPDDRASARVLYWNQKTEACAGELAINYGRPVWKKDYEDPEKFDKMTKGKVWRMGNNFWTVLDTDLPLKISGKDVPVGSYYLGLKRSADGSRWSLAFIDPARARSSRLDGFEIQKAPVKFEVPIQPDQAGAKTEKLTITLSYPKDDIWSVTLKVAWGNMALTAPIKVMFPEKAGGG